MRRSLIPVTLIVLGLALIIAYVALIARAPDTADQQAPPASTLAGEAITPTGEALQSLPTPTPSTTRQPIVPTATPASAGEQPTATPMLTGVPLVEPTPTPTSEPVRCLLPDCLARAGASGRLEDVAAAASAGLPFGNYFNWWLESSPPLTAADEIEFWQMVPVTQDGPGVLWSMIADVIAAQPGATWIVGNEPDVPWQDNTTADMYARIYHDVYTFIKEQDPTAKVAIAGVAQPSPLRFAYLETILATYRALYDEQMPVDIWTVHAFILREEADSWGIGIPPGMDERSGLLYELTDHNDLEIFRQSLFSFREWMTEQGYAGKPLAVTEFGIVHPEDFGFPPDVVRQFMLGAFDFLSTATGEHGDPEDDYHLFQYWFWYSVYDDGDYPTGNLYDAPRDELTYLGQAYRDFLIGE